jgi:hypothetical protein
MHRDAKIATTFSRRFGHANPIRPDVYPRILVKSSFDLPLFWAALVLPVVGRYTYNSDIYHTVPFSIAASVPCPLDLRSHLSG